MRLVLVSVIICGCWTSAEPTAATPSQPPPIAPTPARPRSPTTVKLEVVEGVSSSLPDGTTVDVRGVMYAHMSDSKNLSTCTLTVARDGQLVDIGLANRHGSPVTPPMPKDALGWQFTLEMADPYQQPSRVIVDAVKP